MSAMTSSCLLWRVCGAVAIAAVSLTTHAQTDAATQQNLQAAEIQQRAQAREQMRQEIATQRKVLEARKADAEKACWQRFAVEDCLRNVRSQAREQDNVLHERELRINAEERQEKVQERLRAIERKKDEKQIPAPVQAKPRNAESAVTEQPAGAPGVAAPAATAPKSEADVARAQAAHAAKAQERAAAQAERAQKQQAEMAEHALSEAQRREKVKKNMQKKQQEAEKRRASKADEIANRKGAPLPLPEGLPQPASN